MRAPLRRPLAIAALLALLLLAAPASAAPRLDWTPCRPGFECATANVPLDYDHPSGRKIELALTADLPVMAASVPR